MVLSKKKPPLCIVWSGLVLLLKKKNRVVSIYLNKQLTTITVNSFYNVPVTLLSVSHCFKLFISQALNWELKYLGLWSTSFFESFQLKWERLLWLLWLMFFFYPPKFCLVQAYCDDWLELLHWYWQVFLDVPEGQRHSFFTSNSLKHVKFAAATLYQPVSSKHLHCR